MLGLAHPFLAIWRSSVVAGSGISQAVFPCRMDVTSSSIQERISSSEQPFGCDPILDGMETSSTIGFDGARSSYGSITTGLSAASSFGCLKTCETPGVCHPSSVGLKAP